MNDPNPAAADPLLLAKAAKIELLALDVDGVLTDGKLYFDQSGNEMKTFSTRDGLGIRSLRHFKIPVAIITARHSNIVARRAEELGIELVYQGSLNKLASFKELLAATGVNAETTCYAGDDLIDIPVLDRVGLSVTVADAHPVVRQRVHWVTRHGGGNGAVREICDLILHAKGLDQALLQEILAQ